jgi:basic membrane protein A
MKFQRLFVVFVGLVAAWTASFPAGAATVKVGLVLDKGGKDDKSFNSAAYLGSQRAQKDLKVEVTTVEASDENSFEPFLRKFAQKDYDLIISIGVSQAEAVKKVAALFPQKHFAIVDGDVNSPNVRTMLFEEHEGSFLVGAIAAMKSKSGKLGFIGGMDIPMIRRFALGFESGAKQINPKVLVKSNFIGVTSDAWNNPPKAKELALSQYDSGADVIFAAAGASNTGLFDAAEERKKFAIGVDSNQNWIKPGFILTSMLKRVDLAVYNACKDASEGKFNPGVVRFGLKNEGVDFALDQYNEKLLTPADVVKIKALKAQLVAGKISVPDYYKKKN